MKTRIISGICMLPLLLIVYFGGWLLVVAAILITVLGINEFFNGFENIGIHPSKPIAYALTALLYVIYAIKGYDSIMLCMWLLVAIAICMIYGWDINARRLEDSMATLTGVVYIVFFSYHIVLIDSVPADVGHPTYRLFVWIVIIAAFGADIMAYFVGTLFGKRKLCPVLSPKKTVEGAIGGLLGAALFCGIFGYFFLNELTIHCLIIGLLGGAVSICGDLTASAFKRKMHIKDYGNLIPGHGGIMDRFDSVIFTAPFVFYYMVFVILGM